MRTLPIGAKLKCPLRVGASIPLLLAKFKCPPRVHSRVCIAGLGGWEMDDASMVAGDDEHARAGSVEVCSGGHRWRVARRYGGPSAWRGARGRSEAWRSAIAMKARRAWSRVSPANQQSTRCGTGEPGGPAVARALCGFRSDARRGEAGRTASDPTGQGDRAPDPSRCGPVDCELPMVACTLQQGQWRSRRIR